ncbi:shikimate dehydrogenase [Phototrophicus methaneseepsis]|uniref:Shikimate dehydrogenase (NADP(+)) n=1 Tax=Phototrophicus methaneseepsis TaxID=2710758 RepID=A0A7S8E5K6_9CHLR|nr:shikimate dehydrogenase [Phototrophicus methaneseepsis]QPC80782.1 shikimate dehydrogenase [Phototrophicus methaneseepsis]
MNRVGVIGWPIEHSLSPVMHNAAFQALGMTDWLYDAMAVPPDIARYAVLEPQRHGYIGLNVTVPFKQVAMEYVQPDDKARAIGAVNTIDFRNETGTNTDVDGLINDLVAHDVALTGEKVIVLGAGGAARAAVYGLWQQGAQVVVVNRTKERADDMLLQLTISAGVRNVPALTLDEAIENGASLIVNCTSAGMWPDVENSPWVNGVPYPQGATVYDMIYRPARTKLMQLAETHGGRAISGLGMLVRQGALSFKLWTGVEPPIDVMMQAAQEALAARQK